MKVADNKEDGDQGQDPAEHFFVHFIRQSAARLRQPGVVRSVVVRRTIVLLWLIGFVALVVLAAAGVDGNG